MSSLREMKGIKPKVEYLLKYKPHLRDDDNKLIANLWHLEMTENIETAQDFLKSFSEGNFTSPESIRRMRAKLQEENEEYRGEKYKLRHKEGDNVRKGINT